MAFSWVSLLLVFLAGINTCIGNILLKMSRLKAPVDAGFIEKLFSPYFIGGLFFYGVNVILFAKALDNVPVSVAYPMLAVTGFALIAVTSNYFFNEQLGPVQWLGLGFAVLGIFLLAKPA